MFNQDLIDDIVKGKFILFLGAGVSKAAKLSVDNDYIKDWGQFLSHANDFIPDIKLKKIISSQLKNNDYLMAAELLREALDDQWPALIQKEFSKRGAESNLHKALLRLRPRIIVTTNFDKLVENFWEEYNPNIITKVDGEAFKIFRDESKYLLKIHGSVDDPSAVVFDKTSFQKSAFSNYFYNDFLSTLLLTHTFVFVGVSMSDPAINMVVENYAFRYPKNRPHYLIQSGKPEPEIEEIWKKIRKLYVLRYPSTKDYSGLPALINNLADRVDGRRKIIFSDNVD